MRVEKGRGEEGVDWLTSSVGCQVTHLTSWVWVMSTPIHSKSESGCTVSPNPRGSMHVVKLISK